MDEEADFLRAIAAAPADVGLRLIFADWLDERDDLGGEFLRLRPQMVGLAPDDPEYLRLREREHTLLPECLGRWLAVPSAPVWGLLGGAICPPIPTWLVERNVESWEYIVKFYARLEEPRSVSIAALYKLVGQLAASDAIKLFRAGQSMWTMILSTAPEHGLQEDDDYLATTAKRDGATFVLEYHRRLGQPCDEQVTCEADAVVASIGRLLAQLWSDTHGTKDCPPIPPPSHLHIFADPL